MKTLSLNTTLIEDSACVHMCTCVCTCDETEHVWRKQGEGRGNGIRGRSTIEVHVCKDNFAGKIWDGIVLEFGRT